MHWPIATSSNKFSQPIQYPPNQNWPPCQPKILQTPPLRNSFPYIAVLKAPQNSGSFLFITTFLAKWQLQRQCVAFGNSVRIASLIDLSPSVTDAFDIGKCTESF
ncbi:hypothetical protein PIB30_098829, partial [Stylosanthes scabra]|nr:hypothetical protein [Stylosanthes scabra]